MRNREIADIFDEIADLYEMKGVDFKPRAYRNAAQSIRSLGEDIKDIRDRGELEEIPGVGKSTMKKIEEYLKTGKVSKLDELKEDVPVDIEKITAVESLGPKKVMKLFQELGIKSLEDLEDAAKKGEIAAIEGFGEKTQKKILENIAFAEQKGERFLLGYVLPQAVDLKEKLGEYAERIEIAGSLRRSRETVGDIDILAVPKEGLMDRFTSLDEVKEVLMSGSKKSTVRLHGGIQVDLRAVKDESFGSAMMYFTGSKQHNVHLRRIAQKSDWKLNEYGLFKGEERLAGETEEEVMKKLGLDWIPPEMREDRGEIELAREGKLPALVERGDVISDLQMHSNWSDGKNTIAEMANACKELGHKYMAITDHAGEIRIAHGMDLDRIRKQGKEIREAEKEVDIRILHGIEANIGKDGRIDVGKEAREEVDLVLGAIHSHFRMDRKEMNERLLTAVKGGEFHIFAHPTGRMIQERKGVDVDMDKLFGAAADAGVIMEVNAYPERLDLSGYNVKRAIEAGVRISIGTDSHRTDHLRFIDLGVATARRGWAEKKDIVNTLPLGEFEKLLW